MNTLQTGIAVSLAVLVIGVMFVFPEFSPFGDSSQTAAVTQGVPSTTGINDITMPTASNELQVMDEVQGTGAAIMAGDTITVNYVGMLQNGAVFDASANHGGPATFVIGVGKVIPGWDQGLIGMKEGGKRVLVIPPSLAYGDQGVGEIIPPNSTLTFEVELVKVTHGAQ